MWLWKQLSFQSSCLFWTGNFAFICCFLLLLPLLAFGSDNLTPTRCLHRVPSIEVNSQKELDNLTVGYIHSQISLLIQCSILFGVYITFCCTISKFNFYLNGENWIWYIYLILGFCLCKMHVSKLWGCFKGGLIMSIVSPLLNTTDNPFVKISPNS